MLHFSVSFVLFIREVSCHLSPHPGHIEIEREILQLRLTAQQATSPLHNAAIYEKPLPASISMLAGVNYLFVFQCFQRPNGDYGGNSVLVDDLLSAINIHDNNGIIMVCDQAPYLEPIHEKHRGGDFIVGNLIQKIIL